VKYRERIRALQGYRDNDRGCAFVLDGAGGGPGSKNFCNAPRQFGSAYCPPHHTCCHLPNGSAAERRQLFEIEVLAKAVGETRVARRGTPRPACCAASTALRGHLCDPNVHFVFTSMPMAMQRTHRTPAASLHDAGPTLERRQHGLVERLEGTIGDWARRGGGDPASCQPR